MFIKIILEILGLEIEDLNLLLDNIKKHLPEKNKLLVLGDAELYFDKNIYEKLCNFKKFPIKKTNKTFDIFALGYSLGFKEVETLDINGKATLNINLQKELPKSLLSKYDLIIDSGVLFWCFEPGLALKNIFKMASKGCLIFHVCSLSGHYGTGYYNIHPKLFEDFYFLNNCTFINSSYRCKPKRFKYSWFSVRRKLFPIGSIIKSSFITNYLNQGNIFLFKCSRNKIFFKNIKNFYEPDLIPNRVVSINIFKKNNKLEPKSPLNS